jgi:uncharacterized protein (DUF169 family)
MIDYGRIEKLLASGVGLEHRPVAVTFLPSAPAGVEKFEGVEPSGCSFWKLASAGRTFYTVSADHYNCPIGSYTHRISLPPERARELDDTLGFMTSIGYLRMEEVPQIPRLAETPGIVLYAPLAQTPVDPDVVLLWGPPGKAMVLQEAAIRAGVTTQLATLARPTCMILPAALSRGTVASTACIGNRVYTDLSEADLYVAIPGRDVVRVAEETAVVRSANAALLDYHQARKRKFVLGASPHQML